MKRFIAVLGGLLIMPAFAEVAPIYYDNYIEYTDDFMDDEFIFEETVEDVKPVQPVVPVSQSPRVTTTARTTASRAAPAPTNTNVASRGTAQRPVSTRTTTNTATRGTTSAGTASRANPAQSSGQNVTSRRAASTGTANTARASIVQTDTVNTPLYTGRVGVRTTNAATAAVRAPTTRIATSTAITQDAAVSGPSLDELAQMTDFCKAQYTQCMDNFCDVLDDNQGRCSCSANIKNYAKTEDGLKKATEELQEVAQKIQYIGLTKDEIETLFTQTEAEAAMQGRTDNTQLKNDLDKVKAMIFDVKSGSAVSTETGFSMDLSGLLDFSFDSSGFDLNALFNNGSTGNSISNQRGAELYKTATARCKGAVLDTCRNQGVDTAVITNAYDLEIDKQCIVYERSLTDANTQMTQTVRNAKSVLQKARLVVAQQKNSYDLRGCVNALDSCMQDDFVCGTDYENCLDPTGKYIVNGSVVPGSEPGKSGGDITPTTGGLTSGLYTVWNYSNDAENAWGKGTLDAFIASFINDTTKTTTNMVGYLQDKIGYNDPSDARNYGMCMSVLNKCQDQTYDKNGRYNRSNDVVRGYLQRTLIQIKSAQDEVLASYGENCISEVASCLSSNGYSTTQVSQNAAENACAAIIRTCQSVTGSSRDDIITSATGVYNCPANSTYDSAKTATNAGDVTTYGVVKATKGDWYCTCNRMGTVASGNCP